jgi:hypothetical protein
MIGACGPYYLGGSAIAGIIVGAIVVLPYKTSK